MAWAGAERNSARIQKQTTRIRWNIRNNDWLLNSLRRDEGRRASETPAACEFIKSSSLEPGINLWLGRGERTLHTINRRSVRSLHDLPSLTIEDTDRVFSAGHTPGDADFSDR